MGYRSEIVVKFSDEAARVVKKYADINEKVRELINDAEYTQESPGSISTLFWTWIKWYDSYPEISAFEELLDALPEHHYGLMRSGEEDDDIEERGMPWEYDIFIRKEISW